MRKIQNPNAILLIAGLPQNEKIKNEIENLTKGIRCIRVWEYIKDEDLQKYMNASDVVITPYEKILTSATVILAMGFYKPVIAPLKGCLRQLLSNQPELTYADNSNQIIDLMKKATHLDLDKIGRRNHSTIRMMGWQKSGMILSKIYEALSKK